MKVATIWRWLTAMIICTALSGCGVKFANETLNKDLPKDLTSRTLYPQTAIYKYHLDQLIGSIVYYDNNKNLKRVERVIRDNYIPSVKFVPDTDGVLYKSKINSGASAKGSYLAFSASLTADQMAEVIIRDIAHIYIDDEDVPRALLNKARVYARDKNVQLYWIQGLLLSTRNLEYYQKISTNASGVVGNTAGVEGGVYNSRGMTSKDYDIALELVDLKQYLNIFDKNSNITDFPLYKDAITVKSPLIIKNVID